MHDKAAGLLLILGALTFCVGAAIGVPRVFTEPDRQEKLRMLEERRAWWLAAAPLYAFGPVIICWGVAGLAAEATAGRTLLDTSSALLLLGADGLVLVGVPAHHPVPEVRPR